MSKLLTNENAVDDILTVFFGYDEFDRVLALILTFQTNSEFSKSQICLECRILRFVKQTS